MVVVALLVTGPGAVGEGARATLGDAVKLYRQRLLPDAERALAAVLAKSPDSMPARLLMGWVLWSQERWDEALLRFKSVIHEAPSRRLATSEERLAFNLPTEVLYIDNPDVSQARQGLAWTYVKKGWVRLAHRQFSELNVRYPRWDAPYLGLGYTFLAQRRFDESREAFSAFLDRTAAGGRTPEEGERGLGELYAARGESARAIEHFERALKLRPAWPEVTSLLARERRVLEYKAFDDAWALYEAARYREAAAAFAALDTNLGRMPATMKPFVTNGLAWSKLSLGDVGAAEELFRTSLRELPDGADATAGLGWAAIRRKRWAEAEKAFADAGRLQPGLRSVANGLVELRAARFGAYDAAWMLYWEGKYAQALAAFAAIVKNPGNLPADVVPLAHAGVAWSHLGLGRVDSAEALFKQLKRGGAPHEAEVKAGLGWIALRRKEPAAARKLFDDALATVPMHAPALRGLAELRRTLAGGLDEGWTAYRTGKIAEALGAFSRIVDDQALLPEYRREGRRGRAWALLADNKPRHAATDFDGLLRIGEDGDLLYGRGLARLRLGEHRGAVADLERAVTLVPGAADYRVGLGWALLAADRAQDALRSFLAAFEIAPTSGEVNRGLGWAYTKTGRAAEARSAFRYAAGLVPGALDDKEFRDLTGSREWRDLRRDLAWGYARWQAFEPALALFGALGKADGGDGDAAFGEGYMLYKLGRAAEAEPVLERAIRARHAAVARLVWVVFPGAGAYPIFADPRSILGWTALVQGACDRAIARFDASLERDPEMVASMVGKAECLARTGRRDEAQELLLTASQIYPTYPAVVAGLRETRR